MSSTKPPPGIDELARRIEELERRVAELERTIAANAGEAEVSVGGNHART